jgi:hypothetical protein
MSPLPAVAATAAAGDQGEDEGVQRPERASRSGRRTPLLEGEYGVTWAFAITAAIAGVFGFGAGLLTFKRTSRWCTGCGRTLSCSGCGSQEGVTRPPAVVGLNRGASVR